jgi:hypothetical protein
MSIMLLTYNETLFQKMLDTGTVDLLIDLVTDKEQEYEVREVCTQALIHFALHEKSIKMLMERNLIKKFEKFELFKDDRLSLTIQANISWLFLTLCINGISG